MICPDRTNENKPRKNRSPQALFMVVFNFVIIYLLFPFNFFPHSGSVVTYHRLPLLFHLVFLLSFLTSSDAIKTCHLAVKSSARFSLLFWFLLWASASGMDVAPYVFWFFSSFVWIFPLLSLNLSLIELILIYDLLVVAGWVLHMPSFDDSWLYSWNYLCFVCHRFHWSRWVFRWIQASSLCAGLDSLGILLLYCCNYSEVHLFALWLDLICIVYSRSFTAKNPPISC